MLLDNQLHVNTHHALITDFDKHFVDTGLFKIYGSFKDLVLQINKNEPTKEFAETYFSQAKIFYESVKNQRETNKSTLN